jgi:hypothetical protein
MSRSPRQKRSERAAPAPQTRGGRLDKAAKRVVREREKARGVVPRLLEQHPFMPEYSKERAAKILSRIAMGERLSQICADMKMSPRAVYDWIWNDIDGFYGHYNMALAMQMESWGEEILEIADGADEDNVQVARVQITTRQWMMERRSPRRFGTRQTTEIQFKNPMRRITGEMTPDQAAQAWLETLEKDD